MMENFLENGKGIIYTLKTIVSGFFFISHVFVANLLMHNHLLEFFFGLMIQETLTTVC